MINYIVRTGYQTSNMAPEEAQDNTCNQESFTLRHQLDEEQRCCRQHQDDNDGEPAPQVAQRQPHEHVGRDLHRR